MDQPLTVLLHGAGMDAWIWDRTRPLVRTATLAPDLPSRSPASTPATCAAHVVELIDAHAAGRVVLVMHSLAGVLAADLARLLGARLATCVYVAAVVPAAGSTFAKAMGFPARFLLPLLFRMNKTGLLPSERMIRDELCGDLSAADADEVVRRYHAEFPGLYLSAVGAPPSVRSVYVTLTRDRSVPPDAQARMRARLHAPENVELDAGHLAMLSRPAELAEVVNRVTAAAT